MTKETYGVFSLSEELHNTLKEYIESAYHIRNKSLIKERAKLLEKNGVIAQEPYVEATPSYELGNPYSALNIPVTAKKCLEEISKLNVGVYPRPYKHQADALEVFLGKKNDIIVATGTGSGKTETFLMSILASLAIEGRERPNSTSMPGCRAILLYPMNALVNDQLGRVRKLFGDERVTQILKTERNRPVRFGSYTSKTPYPGEFSDKKNRIHLIPMFEGYYLRHANNEELIAQMKEKGKWPSKNLVKFYGKDKEEKRPGQKYIIRNWDKRLKTCLEDRELLTRHEMQENCPDILITNYSMLEYMLIRPIERPIFEQTKKWLEADERNHLILVLDEAHMYRGTGGTEVALLIRRLMARLGINRERLRCILTSASLGEGLEAETAVKKFARELTGLSESSPLKIELIKGVPEQREGSRAGTILEAQALSKLDLTAFQNAEVDKQAAIRACTSIVLELGWEVPNGILSDFLFKKLTGWGPAELLVKLVSGKAIKLSELSKQLFPNAEETIARKATEALIALGSYAKREQDNKVFLPTRLHLFFRGLPGLYACINPDCSERLDKDSSVKPILGKLYTVPMLQCECSRKGRVFELLTHRDCGTAFLRGYIRGDDDHFILHEPTNVIGLDEYEEGELFEIQMLIDGEPHEMARAHCIEAWLDITTGHLVEDKPKDTDGFIRVYKPVVEPGNFNKTFNRCPVCLKRWRGSSKIMDHATKGETPFAQLVRAQLFLQPPTRKETLEYPNGGRKVLLFSDGRQKAARLARDIPREVEVDAFRQAIALAARKLKELNKRDPIINTKLYIAFISVVSEFNLQFFDGEDRKELINAVINFRENYNGNLDLALDDEWEVMPVQSYYRALLKQLCDKEYSLKGAAVGYVIPSFRVRNQIVKEIEEFVGNITDEDIDAIIFAFLDDLLNLYAFETSRIISNTTRIEAAKHSQDSWLGDGKLSKPIRDIILNHYNCTSQHIEQIEDVLCKRLCHKDGNGYAINLNSVALKIDPDANWYYCHSCTHLMPVKLCGCCINCAGQDLEIVDPNNSEYIKSRKGFLRNSVIKVLSEQTKPKHISVEEHTAQISYKDAGVVFSTTEEYELRFQDVPINEDQGPIDVLSCTTTMEVGIDIGSLVAVGLRNVPPQRENYQQRAGRTGRRGSSVSTVVTFAQGGPHDSHYFHYPDEIVAGQPKPPRINIDNLKITRRHIHSYLIQTFFHEMIAKGKMEASSNNLFSVLGSASDFFNMESDSNFNLKAFEKWVNANVFADGGRILKDVLNWLPSSDMLTDGEQWIKEVSAYFLNKLKDIAENSLYPKHVDDTEFSEGDENELSELKTNRDELLSFLFDEGFLPSYAFPTNLCSFLIEQRQQAQNYYRVIIKERPQQAIDKALSEYAPGRLIVVDKVTYRSGGITAASSLVTDINRAEPLFQENMYQYVACKRCTYVQDFNSNNENLEYCPICGDELVRGELLVPEVFHPECGLPLQEGDTEQDFTYATSAQFPIPMNEDDITDWNSVGLSSNLIATHIQDRRLVMVNKGNDRTNQGFIVCEKCGAASVYDENKLLRESHDRPYFVQPQRGRRVPHKCDGTFRKVFLGYYFKTDLLLLRLSLTTPIVGHFRSSVAINILNASLRTVAEALLLAASYELDVDPAEFQVGYRMLKTELNDDFTRADIYLFDTLTGGAGYAEQVGNCLEAVLERTLLILEQCPGKCGKSCPECLRHYKNQYWHSYLDRHLGASLLRYMIYGEIPKIGTVEQQIAKLNPVIRLLLLDGYKCETNVKIGATKYPLIVKAKGKQIAVGTYPALINHSDAEKLHFITDNQYVKKHLINEYLLDNNLSLVYNQLKILLDYNKY